MSDDKKTEATIEFLDLSIGIEDQMSQETYGKFLDRSAWPALLPDDSFEAIKEGLTTLIKETEGHKAAFENLKERIKNAGK